MDIKVYWILLQLIFGVGNVRFFDLYNKYDNIINLYKDLCSNNIDFLMTDNEKSNLEKISISYAEKIYINTLEQNFDIICYDDKSYPNKLKNIYNHL